MVDNFSSRASKKINPLRTHRCEKGGNSLYSKHPNENGQKSLYQSRNGFIRIYSGKLPIVTSFDVNAGHLQMEVQAGGAIVSCKAVSSNQSHAGTGPKPRRSQSLNPLFLCDQNGVLIPAPRLFNPLPIPMTAPMTVAIARQPMMAVVLYPDRMFIRSLHMSSLPFPTWIASSWQKKSWHRTPDSYFSPQRAVISSGSGIMRRAPLLLTIKEAPALALLSMRSNSSASRSSRRTSVLSSCNPSAPVFF